MRNLRLRSMSAVLALCVGIFLPSRVLGENANPGIIPPNATYGGMTYGEWGAHYLYRFFPGEPSDENLNPKNVYFPQAASANDPTDHFDETIPAGHAVMIMVLASITTTNGPIVPDWGYYDSNWLEADLAWFQSMAEAGGIFCSIDGVPVRNLKDYIVSGAFPHSIEWDALPGVPFDTALGCFLLIKPLTPGHHSVYIEWRFGTPFHLTYDITVIPDPPVQGGRK